VGSSWGCESAQWWRRPTWPARPRRRWWPARGGATGPGMNLLHNQRPPPLLLRLDLASSLLFFYIGGPPCLLRVWPHMARRAKLEGPRPSGSRSGNREECEMLLLRGDWVRHRGRKVFSRQYWYLCPTLQQRFYWDRGSTYEDR
jgi:hypothetical protein